MLFLVNDTSVKLDHHRLVVPVIFVFQSQQAPAPAFRGCQKRFVEKNNQVRERLTERGIKWRAAAALIRVQSASVSNATMRMPSFDQIRVQENHRIRYKFSLQIVVITFLILILGTLALLLGLGRRNLTLRIPASVRAQI